MSDQSVKKPRRWRKTIITLVVVAVLIAGFAARWQIGLTMARNSWKDTCNKLEAHGHPISFAQLEALREVMPDQCNGAWVIEGLHDQLNEIDNRSGVLLFDENKRYPFETSSLPEIDRESLTQSREFLEEYREVLSVLTSLSDRPTGRTSDSYLLSQGDPYEEIRTPVSPYRNAAKLLYLQAVIQFISGEFEESCESVRTIFHVAGALDNEMILVDYLVQQSILALGVQSLETLLAVTECKADFLQEMQIDLCGRVGRLNPLNALRCELLNQVAWAEQMIREKNLLSNVHSAGDLLYVLVKDLRVWKTEEALRESQIIMVENLYPLLEAASNQQWKELLGESSNLASRINAMEDISLRFNPWDENMVPGILSTSFHRSIRQFLRLRGELLSAEVALAVERYRIVNGRFPDTLDELVPEYMEAIPEDPFDGKPLRYVRTDVGVVIYFVSDNGVDDGGLIEGDWNEKEKRYDQSLDDGFRLLDPDKRGFRVLENVQPDDGQE